MSITTLISTPDTVELVRDQIGAILLSESEAQMALARAVDLDPDLWRLRVFLERSLPFEQFWDAPDKVELEGTQAPIVNVWFDSDTFDLSRSNIVERQGTTAKFNIDCYGYGKDEAAQSGHVPGDLTAAFEAQRCMRLVRNILMAAHYTWLGMRGTVWRRWISGRTMFKPQADEQRHAQHVIGARLVLEVQFSEFSPQVESVPLEMLSIAVKRTEAGELYLTHTTEYP